MIAPSMKLWNASPMSTSGTVAAVHLAFVGVAMAKQDQLLEDEERQDAAEQRAEDAVGRSVSSASGSSASSATPSSAPTA